METIRNYLDTMFMQLPDTPEVRRAKSELFQMMEDKYNELITEGKTVNEAIGIVISEFGNLDELSESLGIRGYVDSSYAENYSRLGPEEVKNYIADRTFISLLGGIIAFLGINCADGLIIAGGWSAFRSGIGGKTGMALSITIGMLFLGICIAGIIGISIYRANMAKRWAFINEGGCFADLAAVEYADDQREYNRSFDTMLKVLGIVACSVCFIPVVVLGLTSHVFLTAFGVVIMLVLIGVGVVMIVFSSGRESTYEKILEMNDGTTMAGTFTDSQKELRSRTGVEKGLASLYWPTVTCVYLCYSFLTFRWATSWLIWPIAAVLGKLLTNLTGVEFDKH